jgi:hypothetical protein
VASNSTGITVTKSLTPTVPYFSKTKTMRKARLMLALQAKPLLHRTLRATPGPQREVRPARELDR